MSLYLIKHQASLPVRRIGFVAGGSGVTPLIQLLVALRTAAVAPVQVYGIVSDSLPQHSMLTKELSEAQCCKPKALAALHRTFTGLRAEEEVPAGADNRRIDESMLLDHMPHPSADTPIVVCGPPPFEAGVGAMLLAIGHPTIILLSSGELLTHASRDRIGADHSAGCAHGCSVWTILTRTLVNKPLTKVSPDSELRAM